MKYPYFSRLLTCLAALLFLWPALTLAAPFTPGNIVVARVGSGSAALTGNATAVFLVEYTPAGTLVQTISLPTSVGGLNRILTASGTATSELNLTRSADERYLVLTGYSASPGTANIASTASTDIVRVIGRVTADGRINTSTTVGDAFSGNNIRAAATADGLDFFVVGGNSGVRYATLGGVSSTQLNTAPTNIRFINTVDGNLYLSSSSNPNIGVSQVGTGLPTTASQSVTLLPGFPGTITSPYAFYFADLDATVVGVDVVYVTDDRTGTNGGIQKWSLVSGTWVLNGTITSVANPGLRGLNGTTSGTTVALIAAASTGLFAVSDNAGYNLVPSTTALPAAIVTAPANTAFRGVSFAPVAPAPTVVSFTPISGLETTTVTVTGTNFTDATALTLNGAAITGFVVVNATTITFTVPAGATSGPVAVTTPGGTATSAGTFTVILPNPVPTITSLNPNAVVAGAGAFTVVITGTGFLPTSTVTFDGTPLPPSSVAFGSATQLTLSLPAGATVGTYALVVVNPAPGGGTSNTVNFTVTPAPTITALSPSTAVAGSAGFLLTVTGSNFTASSGISFNGVALPTTLVSATQLTATVPASAVATVGTLPVTITTSSPGGTTSATVNFLVTTPVPTIVSFTPTTGGPATTVTVTGTNFTGATAVRIGSFAVTNFTVVSATTITLVVPSGTGSVAGLISVTTRGGTATSATTFNLVSAVLASNALPGLRVFPNPFADHITVALPTAGAAIVALRDLTGRLVVAPTALLADQQFQLPATLATGVYLLEVKQGATRAIRRVEKR